MTNPQTARGGKPPRAPLSKGWLKLFLAALLIAACVYLSPNLENLPLVGSGITLLRESGINVGAWYYDDVEEYFEAERYMRERLHSDHSKK